MDEEFIISTPEQVAFSYETAGIGSRSLAAVLDHLIIISVLLLMDCALAFLLPAAYAGGSLAGGDGGSVGGYIALALLVLVQFLFLWGYFVLFELIWRGRTPGKRVAKLRVLRRDGQPIGAGEAIIRNLVRLVDFLPLLYGIGLITMFVDKEARRLGDFAAGTIVVKESEQVALRDVRVHERPALYAQTQYPYNTSGNTGDQSAIRNPQSAIQEYDPLPGISLRDVTPEDYRLIREVMQRVSRGELQLERGQELASWLAYGVASRMGFDFAEWQQRGWDPVVFLQSVLYARDARGE